jgi:hypothetical protein
MPQNKDALALDVEVGALFPPRDVLQDLHVEDPPEEPA